MKMVVISDTHGMHRQLALPSGDVLIHAGDITRWGSQEETMDFLRWFSEQPFAFKVFIAGNHDFYLERIESPESIIPESVIYLNDSAVTIRGLHFWGSPVQPYYYGWAFNRKRGPEIDKHWQSIPSQTDILITHGPPQGILDKNLLEQSVGCEDLRRHVDRVKPQFHLFGHIHESHGQKEIDGTIFINASVMNEDYQLVHHPFVAEVPG
jgi:Icc-related predicted phosphoesterase